MIAFACLSIPSTQTKISSKGVIGLLLSFISVYLFRSFEMTLTGYVWLALFSSIIFYLFFLIISLVSLGRNFGLIPSLRNIVINGSYTLVRHPIYSAYTHIIISLFLIFSSFQNFVILIAFFIGVILRINEEEKLLKQTIEYQQYVSRTQNKIFNLKISFPLLLLGVVAIYFKFFNHNTIIKAENLIKLKINSQSPIISLNPLVYDEWGSVLVGNLIYPRLIPDLENRRLSSVGKLIKIECLKLNEHPCTHNKILIEITPLKHCNGSLVNEDIVRKELNDILSAKNWIFNKWSYCNTKPGTLCLEVKETIDIERRLQNIYMRFGWSLNQNNFKNAGVYPYCFNSVEMKNHNVTKAILTPLVKKLPKIELDLLSERKDDFDISLYGEEDFLNKNWKNHLTHTPAAYYVVSNPASPRNQPWNLPESRKLIASHLLQNHLIISDMGEEFNHILPKGLALNDKVVLTQADTKFFIPNFIKDCSDLATALNKFWLQAGIKNSEAYCGELTQFLYNNVSKKREWFGFLSPLSVAGSFRNALSDQYFNPRSNDSWIKTNKPFELYFYRLGIAQLFVTTNDKFCNILNNSLGLSDLQLSDFQRCEK